MSVLSSCIFAPNSTTTQEETTTTTEDKTVEVTYEEFQHDIKENLIRSLEFSNEKDITDPNNFTILKSDKYFTYTPLQKEFIANIDTINELLGDVLAIYNDLLLNVTFYEDNTYKFKEVDHLTVLESDLPIVDNILTINSLKIELGTEHDLVDKYQLDENVIIDISRTATIINIKITDIFSFNMRLSNKDTQANYSLNNKSIELDIDNSNSTQVITLEVEKDDVKENMYFYGNNYYGAILNDYVKQTSSTQSTSMIDYEVFRYKTGLLYKSLTKKTQDGTEIKDAFSMNGFTSNLLVSWESLTSQNGLFTLNLNSGPIKQNELDNGVIEVNDTDIIFSENGYSAININDLYSNEKYYVAGYFLQTSYHLDHFYNHNITDLVNLTVSLNDYYLESIESIKAEINKMYNPETVKLEYKKINATEYDPTTQTNIVILEETANKYEVMLFNKNDILTERKTYNGKVSYINGTLFVYGSENNIPYLEVKTINSNSRITDQYSFSWNYLKDHTISSFTYNKTTNKITVMYKEKLSNYTNTLIVDLTTLKTEIQYSTLIDEFTDSSTNTKVKIVKNESNLLFIMLYNQSGTLVQVSSGQAMNANNVALTNYKVQGTKLILFGQNSGRPYFIVPQFTGSNTIDFENTLSFSYTATGKTTDVNYLTSENLYEVVMLLSNNETKTIKVTTNGLEKGTYVKLGYLTDWSNWDPNDLKFNKLTHINYSFGHVADTNGTVVANFSRAHQIKQLKEKNPQLSVIFSLGGWGSGNFSEAASTDANRKLFSRTAIEIMLQYDMDGIDIDWEYPGSGVAGITYSPNDKANFVLMLKQLREDLDNLEAENNRDYLLTIAVSGYVQPGYDLPKIVPYLDFLNVMTYDLNNWGYASHNSHLYKSDLYANNYGAADYIQQYLNKGVPASKLNIGIAFYGRGGVIQTETPNILGSKLVGDKSYTYSNIKNNYLNKNGFVRYWDDKAKTPYLYNPNTKEFISYEDQESIQAKIDYVKEKGLLGVFFWEYSQDNTGDLINAIDVNTK